ncbi:MAG TPA: RNA polymerase sigma factor [Candidatus Aminicenantes bacterium]|nr:RNA polymerase sigma factor [Candidatus Aminicenantes bacterium]
MNEQETIDGCLAGDPLSQRAMVEAYGDLVLSVALNVIGNRQDAEDVCQETFLQVFRRLARYDRARSFKTWLLTIAYRRSLDMLRKKRRFKAFSERARFEPAVAGRGGNPHPAAPEPLPSALLKKLSPRERAALTLWANEGLTAKDISAVLACSASTARVFLFNARRKIKALLENAHVLQNG